MKLAKENFNQKQVAIKTSTRSLDRSENAQPTYEKSLNELNKAEAAVVQAQEDLSNAKLELRQVEGVLKDLEAQQAKQRRLEALQKQVAKEQQRLEREAKQNQMLVASTTPADKTPELQPLSVSKPKAQALTHSESRKTKQAEKAPETLPHTGEQQSIWLTIMGLLMAVGAISFKNKKRKNS